MYRKVVFYDFIQKLFLLMEEQEITKEKLKIKLEFPQQLWQNSPKMKMFQCQQFKVFAIFDCQPGAILSYEKKLIKILLFSDFVKKWK